MRTLIVILVVAVVAAIVVLLLDHDPGGTRTLATREPPAVLAPEAPAGPPALHNAPPRQRTESRQSAAPDASPDAAPTIADPRSGVDAAPAEPLTFTVKAVDGSGKPIAGAVIGIRFTGDYSYHDRDEADKHGIVRFELRPSLGDDPFSVWSFAPRRGLASHEVELHSVPDEQPFVLVLEEGGWLDVTVLESVGGLPVEGARVSISIDRETNRMLANVRTDANGFAALGPLVPGLRPWYVGAPGAEHNVRGASEITLGQHTAIEVALDEGGEPLALEGVYVDEDNVARPVGQFSMERIDHPTMWVGPSRSEGKLVHADAWGRFRVHMPPCDELIVLLNVAPSGHRYEPESMTVPFGTRGLRLRIAEKYDEVKTRFVVRDEATGEAVPKAFIVVYRDDPWKAKESCITRKPEPGTYVVEHRDWPNLQYVVRTIGYEHVYGVLNPSTRADGIEVTIRRGLLSPVVVLDDATLIPIEGARFINNAGDTIATSDAHGAAELRGPVADGRLRVVARGYAPRRWYASWPTPRVTLVQE